MLTAIMMVVVALLVASTVGSGHTARQRAAAAADLAALAAAEELSGSGDHPCQIAERVTRINGAQLRECVVDGAEVVVAASAPITGPLRWLADPVRRARAGAPPPVRVGLALAGEWLVPVAGPYRLTARFGETGSHWASGTHTGLDFAAPVGTPVIAASGGRVIQAGYAGPYGHLVVVDHGDVTTHYAHLSTISVSLHDAVGAGQQIGAVGATGNVTGPHLHFEVRVGGKVRDPANVLPP
jgi:secretion/DNA translocation related TadE-like protein